MKRIKKLMAVLLVLTVCLSTFAATIASASQTVYLHGSCNLRRGPGLGYSIKRSMPSGERAFYLGSRRRDSRGITWLKVEYRGTTGWVSTRYASFKKSGGGSGSHSHSHSGGGSGSGRVKTTGSVHIRTSPSLSGRIIGSVGAGVRLKYRGTSSRDHRGVRWYGVYYNGRKGWVSSRYSRLS